MTSLLKSIGTLRPWNRLVIALTITLVVGIVGALIYHEFFVHAINVYTYHRVACGGVSGPPCGNGLP